jgi:hypothetical protein
MVGTKYLTPGVAPLERNHQGPEPRLLASFWQRGMGTGRSVGTSSSRHTLRTVKIPIACTLEPGDARSQFGEWEEVLRRVVDGSQRVSPNRLELRLLPDADVGSLISLAQREAACCAFFSFTVVIHADRLVLTVEVPDDAIEVLDQLVSTSAT